MPNVILTPVTLWKDFDDSLPFNEELLSETERNGYRLHEMYFLGRQTQFGRVKIYAKYYMPCEEERYPAVLLLFEAGFPVDERLVMHLLSHGYAVFCVDYCGDMEDGSKHTIYPRDIEYANFLRAGRAMEHADHTAKETSWYEWAAVARYGARYLNEQKQITKTGVLGLRTGGEVLWKIAPYAPISCMISVCAAGWLAYRGIEKFANGDKIVFDEERHRFIAGIDSQSYAPHVKCPVMLLSAINDKKSNYDRVYDTFQQINPKVDKAFLYSAHGNGLIGSHSIDNIDLFLDKYLKGRSVYLSQPVSSSVYTDENGALNVKISCDPNGEPEEYGIFFTEKISAFKARDWTRVMGKAKELKNNNASVPLDVYVKSDKALIYSFVRYSNGFSVTSKIQEVALHQPYSNSRPKSRILYVAENGISGFSVYRNRALSIADCFAGGERNEAEIHAGYGGLLGISCRTGLVSYRVSEPRFDPPRGAAFKFDAYCANEDGEVTVCFYADDEEEKGYTCTYRVPAGGVWKKFVCESGDFKTEKGVSLPSFEGVVSVVLFSKQDVLVNQLVWL